MSKQYKFSQQKDYNKMMGCNNNKQKDQQLTITIKIKSIYQDNILEYQLNKEENTISLNSQHNMSTLIRQQPLQNDNYNKIQQQQQQYNDQQFQSTYHDSYLSKVQSNFNLNLQHTTQHNIEISLNQMRNFMKTLSTSLDAKIHKYYGLMALKHPNIQHSPTQIINYLNNQKITNQKLIQTQLQQIHQIQTLDKQMASTKRVQKQAQRLKNYFQTKKAMITADQQTRFSKGQINKAAQYLARDLDTEKHYFRLNKIKQDLQYAILRDNQMTKKNHDLDNKLQLIQQKHSEIIKTYNQKIQEAQKTHLLLPQNKQLYQEHKIKQELLQKKQQIQKKIQISSYNLQKSIESLSLEVQKLRKNYKKYDSVIDLSSSRIISTENQIKTTRQTTTEKQFKLNQSIFLKNIDNLIKNKKLQSSSSSIENKQKSTSNSISKRLFPDLSQSSVIMKPNFKIRTSKQKLDSSQLKVNKSMDFQRNTKKTNEIQKILQGLPKSNVISKRILKFQPFQRNIKNAKTVEKKAVSSKQINPQFNVLK